MTRDQAEALANVMRHRDNTCEVEVRTCFSAEGLALPVWYVEWITIAGEGDTFSRTLKKCFRPEEVSA